MFLELFEPMIYWGGLLVMGMGSILIVLAYIGIVVDVIVNHTGKRIHSRLVSLHGIIKVDMMLANSKYIRWQLPEGDD